MTVAIKIYLKIFGYIPPFFGTKSTKKQKK